jgi:transcriptional regulator with XRE-family HTH domain
MSPEELRHLRRRLRLTQVQFAHRLGVSPALVTSLECGRRRITERRVREIARVFGDNLYKRPPVLVQNTVPSVVQKTGSPRQFDRAADRPASEPAQPLGRSLTLVDLYRELTGTAPVRAAAPTSGGPVLPPIAASAPTSVSKSVQTEQPATTPVSNPASVLRPVPAVTGSRCTWRDLEVAPCGALTPQGMLYCAVHMALAMIEGRPTRRR